MQPATRGRQPEPLARFEFATVEAITALQQARRLAADAYRAADQAIAIVLAVNAQQNRAA